MQLLRQYPNRTTVLVFMLAFFVMLAVMVRDVNIYDEGIILVGAMRTLAGEIKKHTLEHLDYYLEQLKENVATIKNFIKMPVP